jgi:hypothetical protein
MINDRRYGISWFYVTTRKEQKTYIVLGTLVLLTGLYVVLKK